VVVEFRVLSDGDCRLIVNVEDSGERKWLVKFRDKSPESDDLLSSVSHSNVLGLSAGEGNGALLFKALEYGATSKHA